MAVYDIRGASCISDAVIVGLGNMPHSIDGNMPHNTIVANMPHNIVGSMPHNIVENMPYNIMGNIPHNVGNMPHILWEICFII